MSLLKKFSETRAFINEFGLGRMLDIDDEASLLNVLYGINSKHFLYPYKEGKKGEKKTRPLRYSGNQAYEDSEGV